MLSPDGMVRALLPLLVRWVRTFSMEAEIMRVESAKATANAMCHLTDTSGYKAYWPIIACAFCAALASDEDTPPDLVTTDMTVQSWQYRGPARPIHLAARDLSRIRLEMLVMEIQDVLRLLHSLEDTALNLGLPGAHTWLSGVRALIADDLVLIRAGLVVKRDAPHHLAQRDATSP